LLNLQTEVEAQQSQVCHLELQLHLPLESSNFFWSRVGDEQVTNVHTDDQPASAVASAVNGMLVLTLYEAELAERAIKFSYQARRSRSTLCSPAVMNPSGCYT
jgi:hypothetical protein